MNRSQEELVDAASSLDMAISADLNHLEVGQIDGKFDLIICSHVLEHLADPKRVLAMLASCLEEDGRIFVVVPNFGAWWVRLRILRGRFSYEDYGVFDRTHLRFFTALTAASELRPPNLEVVDRIHRGHLRPWVRKILPASVVKRADDVAL